MSRHEKRDINPNTSGGDPGEIARLCRDSTWGMGRTEGGGVAAPCRGTTARMGDRDFGMNPTELKQMDAQGQRGGTEGACLQASFWEADAADSQDASRVRRSLRAIADGVWVAACAVGWPHAGEARQAPVWRHAFGASGSGVDASDGIWFKTRQ